jgi:hypothetical protein
MASGPIGAGDRASKSADRKSQLSCALSLLRCAERTRRGGASRLHGELLNLGFQVAQSTVAKYMIRRRGPPSQGWKTFLRNHVPHIGAIDLFVVPTAGFKLLYGLVIIRLQRRHPVWINVTTNPTADWIACQITEAFPWAGAPVPHPRQRRLLWSRRKATPRGHGHPDRPTAPRSPWQNAHVEHLIGSIRRECLDHVVVLGEARLRPGVLTENFI